MEYFSLNKCFYAVGNDKRSNCISHAFTLSLCFPFDYFHFKSRQDFLAKITNSEHRRMRAKQQHVCKEMNQYTNNTNRKWFLSFSIEWTIGANDRKQPINQNKK